MNDSSINPCCRGLSRSLPLTANTITKHGLQFPSWKASAAFGKGCQTAAAQLVATLSWAFLSFALKGYATVHPSLALLHFSWKNMVQKMAVCSKSVAGVTHSRSSQVITTPANGLQLLDRGVYVLLSCNFKTGSQRRTADSYFSPLGIWVWRIDSWEISVEALSQTLHSLF